MVTSTLKTTVIMLLALGVALMAAPSVTGLPAGDPQFSEKVDRLFTERITSSTPGAAVVVTSAGKPVFTRCYGLADLEHGVPVTASTAFNLASAAKQFTAFSILLLEQKGRIDLDDDVHKYLPELPPYNKPVTIRHLLHHTSGIWEYYSTMTYYCGYDLQDHFTLKEIMELLQHQKALLFEPGSQWSYCNTNYVLLAQIVERIAGVPFQQWTKSNIFDPLGMSHSLFIKNSSQLIPGKAEPYRKADEQFIDDPGNWVDYVGQGYLYSTLDDMMLWMDNFRTKKLGGDEIVEKMFQKATLNDGSQSFYGYGLGVLPQSGKLVVSHSGQTGGYKSYMLYCPELELGITVLANQRSMDSEGLGKRIFDLYLGKEVTEAGAADSQPDFLPFNAESAARYAGGYVVEGMGAKLGVNVEETYLHCAFWGLGEDFFYPTGERTFANRSRSNSVEFLDDEDGTPNRAAVSVRDDKFIARRIILDAKEVEARLSDYAGDYYSPTFEVVYGCRVENGRLFMHHRRYGNMPMQPIDAEEFLFILGFAHFNRGSDGEVVGFTLTPSDEGFHFQTIEFTKVSSAE